MIAALLGCLALGGLLGWLVAGRRVQALRLDLARVSERAAHADRLQPLYETVEAERQRLEIEHGRMQEQNAYLRPMRAALEAERDEACLRRDEAHGERERLAHELADLRARSEEQHAAHERLVAELKSVRESLPLQFGEVAKAALDEAQARFLERANDRFKESEAVSGAKLATLLQPVHERLEKYEAAIGKVEAERRDAFGVLTGQIESMRAGTERVSSEAAKLVNALRNAPKARGRWGEQQLKNVLESCGLSEHADFQTEVNVEGSDGGRLRPDVIIRIPGGQSLVIDAKVSLNAYQDAFGSVDEGERGRHLTLHATSMRTHVNGLGNKAYWNQFDTAPDYVIMFVPGEHFLSAALEHDPTLWDFAFEKKVLLATPTNLIAIARTIAAVWRQEKLAGQAREIAELGKELYARIATMGAHVGKLGRNLDTAVTAYNAFVGSLETQVLTQARRFEGLNVDTGAKAIDGVPLVEQIARPLTKLPIGEPVIAIN